MKFWKIWKKFHNISRYKYAFCLWKCISDKISVYETSPERKVCNMCLWGKTFIFLYQLKSENKICISFTIKSISDRFAFSQKISYVNTAEAVTCVIPHPCNIITDFGPVPEHIKQQIKILVHESETLPKRFIDIIISKLWIEKVMEILCKKKILANIHHRLLQNGLVNYH